MRAPGSSCVRLHFLSPSHKKEQWCGHFPLSSWLRIFLLCSELSEVILSWDYSYYSVRPLSCLSFLTESCGTHSLSPSRWPVGGATWQDIRKRRGWRRTAEMTGKQHPVKVLDKKRAVYSLGWENVALKAKQLYNLQHFTHPFLYPATFDQEGIKLKRKYLKQTSLSSLLAALSPVQEHFDFTAPPLLVCKFNLAVGGGGGCPWQHLSSALTARGLRIILCVCFNSEFL